MLSPRAFASKMARLVKGSVEVKAANRQGAQPQNEKPQAQAKPTEPAKPAEPPKAAAAAASAATSATLAHGSKVMYNESN